MVLSYCSDSVFFIKAGTATTIATALTLGKDLIWMLMIYSSEKKLCSYTVES